MLGVLVCVRASYDEILYFLTCLRTLFAFLSYLLYILILNFKNSYSEKVEHISYLHFDTNLKTIWNQLKGSRKLSRYIAAAAIEQYQFFTVYILTYYINFCWIHCFCLIYCKSSYWLLLLFNTITFLDWWMKCCSFAFACSKWNCCKTTF